MDYFADVYVDPETTIIAPHLRSNALYFIYHGSVNVHYNIKKSMKQ